MQDYSMVSKQEYCGSVFWITGLSNAGKSSIAIHLQKKIIAANRECILLDGDVIRHLFGSDLGYDNNQRRLSAWRNIRLCKGISDQSIDVICATISMFEEVRQWGRKNIEDYYEIYVSSQAAILEYRRGFTEKVSDKKNIVGGDLSWEEPTEPDLIINNNNDETVADLAEKIWRSYSADNNASSLSQK